MSTSYSLPLRNRKLRTKDNGTTTTEKMCPINNKENFRVTIEPIEIQMKQTSTKIKTSQANVKKEKKNKEGLYF